MQDNEPQRATRVRTHRKAAPRPPGKMSGGGGGGWEGGGSGRGGTPGEKVPGSAPFRGAAGGRELGWNSGD